MDVDELSKLVQEKKEGLMEAQQDLDQIQRLIEDLKDQNQRTGLKLKEEDKRLNQVELEGKEVETQRISLENECKAL